VGAAAVGIATQALIANLLGVSAFGVYAFALSIVNFLAMLGVFGFETASLRFIAAYRGSASWKLYNGYRRKTIEITALWSSVLAIALLGAIALGAGRHQPGLAPVLMVGAFLLPVLALLKIFSAHLQALQKILLGQGLQGLLRPALLAVGLATAFLGLHPRNAATIAMTVNVMVTAIVCGVAWYAIIGAAPSDAIGKGRTFETQKWLRVSVPLFLITISQTLLTSADTLMLGAMAGTRAAGMYAVASQVATVVAFSITAANAIVAPMIAELFARNRMADLQRLIVLASRSVIAVSAPVLVLVIVLRHFLMGVFGPGFSPASSAMVILSFGQFAIVLFGSVGFLMTMTGKETEASRIIGISAVANVGLNLMLIPRFGLEGAATATSISVFLRSYLLSRRVRNHMQLRVGFLSLTED
jgi:O-antigen/teichoic acid export membrane protein